MADDTNNEARVRPYVMLEEVDLAEHVRRVELMNTHLIDARDPHAPLRGTKVLVRVRGEFVARNTTAAYRAAGKALAGIGRRGSAHLAAVVGRYWAEDDIDIGDPPITVGGDK